MMQARPLTKHLLVLLIITALVGLFYGNTLKNGFIHDDHGQIEQNQYIQSWQYLPKVLSGCIWEAALGGCKERTSYYRPLQSLSYLITYSISSSPLAFHFVNLLYFIAAGFLVYILSFTLTQHRMLSVMAATLFTAHPVNNETVNWIATVPELLYLAFVLLGTVFYIRYRQTNNLKYLIFVFLFYTLGLLAKEPAFLLPLVLAAFDWLYLKHRLRDFLRWKVLRIYGFLAGIFAGYLGLRVAVLGHIESGSFYSVSLQDRFIAFFELLGQYLAKLFYPHPLLLFYYPFKISQTLLAPKFLISFAVGAVLLGLIIWLIRKQQRFLAFSLVWLFVFLLPPTLFLNALGENVFSERYIFASSIGFSFVLAYGLIWLAQKNKQARTATALILVILLSVSLKIIWNRNQLWQDDKTLYTTTLQQNPKADLIRYNLAVSQRDSDQTEQALENFKIIEQRGSWRDIYKVYNNLGNIFRQENDPAKAEAYFNLALKGNPNNDRAYNNLGALSLEKGQELEALKYFCKALAINPNLREANANFSRLVSMIQSVNDVQYLALYQDVIHGGAFLATASPAIVFENKWCSSALDGQCHYIFRPQLPKNEIMLPFLIMGTVNNSEIVKINQRGFDPKTNTITFDLPDQYSQQNIEFIFPTCDGVYYKVTAS